MEENTMARFNAKISESTKTTNHEGAIAYKLTPELELYATVCTASLQDKFYEKADETLTRIRALIKKVDPMFVAKLAVYAREQMYLRSIPLVLVIELNKQVEDKSLIVPLTKRVIQRADEITELLAYYQTANPQNAKEVKGNKKKLCKLSKALSKGIAESFHKFDEYQFAKYNTDGEVKLRDALFLTHPKPMNPTEVALFKKIAQDTLDTPYTWEVELSTAKAKGKEKKQVWQELIDSNKLGYMALLRNLRNILQEDVSKEHMIKVAKAISDPEQVRKSKQLPFRFLSAYKELAGSAKKRGYSRSDDETKINSPYVSLMLDALEDAIAVSAENVPGFGYDTSILIASDVSGSMQKPVSEKSKIENYDIGLTLSMVLQHRCKVVQTGIFGDSFKIKALPKKAILANVLKLYEIEGEVGYSTNGYKVIRHLIETKQKVDKVMIFTDCQMWNSDGDGSTFVKEWNTYKSFNPSAKLYLFDLSGYGNTPISTREKDVYLIAGWSEKVFGVLSALEEGKTAIDVINKVTL
jgi:hypothetical protein